MAFRLTGSDTKLKTINVVNLFQRENGLVLPKSSLRSASNNLNIQSLYIEIAAKEVFVLR